MGRTLGDTDKGQVSLGAHDRGTLHRSKLALWVFKEPTFKRVNILFLDSLLRSWSPRDETITMAVVLSCSGILWCETLSCETLTGQLVGDSGRP